MNNDANTRSTSLTDLIGDEALATEVEHAAKVAFWEHQGAGLLAQLEIFYASLPWQARLFLRLRRWRNEVEDRFVGVGRFWRARWRG